ncbi:hypothetical protein CBS147346_910 [Aspergillus niger]|nr:hypothetical protein CBS147346_910 [Aspergillus niger]GLA29720.1 hypothetical protein AnigIFM63326_007631 [Aspergillus niger]
MKAARHITKFITQLDEVLVMSGADLELLEQLWTGTVRSYPEEREEEFYVVLECGWYFTRSWQITRELSCFALSKSAFNAMKSHARFSVRRKAIEVLHQRERRCSRQVLQQCVGCLAAGSRWQVLLAAISSTLVTIYPLPVRRREDFAPSVDVLGLGYIPNDRVRTFIMKYLKRVLWKPRRQVLYTAQEFHAAMRQGYTREELLFATKAGKQPKDTIDMSWKRVSEQRTHLIDGGAHDFDLCERCRQKPETIMSPFAHRFLDARNQPLLSDYGTVLSLAHPAGSNAPDACVFALRPVHDLKDNLALSTMVEDLMQGAYVYHTRKCDVSEIRPNTFMDYNLLLPYRTADKEMELCLLNWVRELRDEPLLDKEDHPGYKAWAQEKYDPYKFMFYLSIGLPEPEALLPAKIAKSDGPVEGLVYRVRRENGKDIPWGIDPHRTLKLSGDVLVPQFSTWGDGLDFLGKEYPKQAQELLSLTIP